MESIVPMEGWSEIVKNPVPHKKRGEAHQVIRFSTTSQQREEDGE